MNHGSLQFPTYSDMNFDLDVGEENRDIRIQYARLPFRLLVPGNRSKYGRALNVDCEDSWHHYLFSSLSKLAKCMDHPSGFGTGILLLCPKEGAIIGPISPGSTEKHSCFVDRIHHFLDGGDAGATIPCRLLCPHVPSHTSRPRSSTHHSFIDAIADSSKFLLYEAYGCRHLNSPLQLFPLLSFDILGDADFENDMATLLPNLREHVERYFKGVGHPDDPLFTNLVSSTQLATDNQDVCYRARRFVKLISGITLLPPGLKDFTIAIHQDISVSATFNGHYDIHKDFLPPMFHACTYQMDLWANNALRSFLRSPLPRDNNIVTPFDACLHAALIDAGEDSFNA
ncbi:hypothetical protein C8R48DRAFT_780068 [Suillus tomentosus]|nr:hypothetical protein C8R48DRAFT_780068 [Suillus tomentosus]